MCDKPNKRGEKLTSLTTGTGETTRQHMLQAAEKRRDQGMLLRMLFYTDLFASEAKYHRSCYGHYISERNVKAAAEKAAKATSEKVVLEKSQTASDEALHLIYLEMNSTVLSKKKSVLLLSDLQSRFTEILRDKTGDSETSGLSSWKLKEKLRDHFGCKMVFIPQSGKSNLVCPKDVIVRDALKKVTELSMEISDQGEFEAIQNAQEDDTQV